MESFKRGTIAGIHVPPSVLRGLIGVDNTEQRPRIGQGPTGDPVWIRTKDRLLRRQVLYPAELRDRKRKGAHRIPPEGFSGRLTR